MVLYPELDIRTVGCTPDTPTIWGDVIQQWTVSADGVITNKHFEELHLALKQREITMAVKFPMQVFYSGFL